MNAAHHTASKYHFRLWAGRNLPGMLHSCGRRGTACYVGCQPDFGYCLSHNSPQPASQSSLPPVFQSSTVSTVPSTSLGLVAFPSGPTQIEPSIIPSVTIINQAIRNPSFEGATLNPWTASGNCARNGRQFSIITKNAHPHSASLQCAGTVSSAPWVVTLQQNVTFTSGQWYFL